jgi:hypothetical protein
MGYTYVSDEAHTYMYACVAQIAESLRGCMGVVTRQRIYIHIRIHSRKKNRARVHTRFAGRMGIATSRRRYPYKRTHI